MLSDLRLHKKEDEGLREYLWRVGKMKEHGEIELTWEELCPILNENCGCDFTESAWRKKYMEGVAWNEIFSDADAETSDELEELRKERQEINKAKVLLRDERNELNRRLREQARVEDQVSKIGDKLSEIGMEHFPVAYHRADNGTTSERDMIVCVSDLHIGMCFSSTTGQYNTGIAYRRMSEYSDTVLNYAIMHRCNRCYVAILGDNINGLIHEAMRVSNRENVIEQVKNCAELLTEFVYSLSGHFSEIVVTSVPGNHSRLMPNKDADLVDERLDDIIPWYMESALRHIKNVRVEKRIDGAYGTYAQMSVRGKNYVLVHGDDDSFTENGIAKLCMWLGYIPYCVISGHKHVPAMMEAGGVVCIQSGSLSGSGDRFTNAHRLKGEASQTILICGNDGIEAMYPVHFSE